MKTKIVLTLALMIILLISALITPNLAFGQITSMSQQNANPDPNEKASFASPERLALSMALKYLSTFGYKSPAIVQFNATEHEVGLNGAGTFNVLDNGRITTVQVTSNFLFEKSSPDYKYNAQFTLRNGTTYSVEECSSEIIDGSQVEATFTQKISGSFNFSLSAIQETTLAKQMTKTTDINMEFSNSTGTYYARCQSNALLGSDGAEVISGSLTIDQNIFSQRGRYSYSFSPKTDSLGTKCLMTMPNGAVVDPSSTLYISADGDYLSHLDVYLIGFTAAEQAGEGFLEAIAGMILFIISNAPELAFLAAVLAPLGGLLAALALFTASAYFLYPSSMDGIIMLYIKYVCLMWHGPFLWETRRLPLYLEFGFFTDQYAYQALGDWYYYPVFSSLTGYGYAPYTCDWPLVPDPYVTFQGYDEATSTYVDGIPIYINGTVVGVTCSTLFLTPGTYIVQAPNYGGDSFHYFDVDGVPVYDNPATITVPEEDITIGIHYYYMPYHFVGSITDYNDAVYPGSLIGSPPDGLFATIWGYGPYQYYGWISGVMTEPAIGHIYVYGSGGGPLYVYVSSNGYDWNYVSSPYVTTLGWIDCGSYLSPFNYIKLTAEDPNSVYSIDLDAVCVYPPNTYFTLTISSGSGGSTTPSPGAYQYAVGTPVAVTANPNSGYILDYWLLDGQNVGSQNPITVNMYDAHTLQANFRTTPYHWLTVDAYDGYCGYPLDANIYIDGNYAGTGYAHVQVTEGWHTIWVDDPVWNPYWSTYSYLWYFTDSYGNGESRPVYSDTYISAVYYPW